MERIAELKPSNITFSNKITVPTKEKLGVERKSDVIEKKFEVYADTFHTAIISGSTFSGREEEAGLVLDGAAIGFGTDEDGVRVAIVQATADGCGHPQGVREQESIAHVAGYVSHQIVNQCCGSDSINIHKLKQCNEAVGLDSKKESFTILEGAKQRFNSTAVVVSCVVTNTNGLPRATFGNIGDCMAVVLDGNAFEVKCIMPARQYQTPGSRSPVSIQLFANPPTEIVKVKNRYHEVEMNLNENDIIVQMTDGIWEELPTQTNSMKEACEGGIDYTESKIDADKFSKRLCNYFKTDEEREAASAYEIAKVIRDIAVEHNFEIRAKRISIVEYIHHLNQTTKDKNINFKSLILALRRYPEELEIV